MKVPSEKFFKNECFNQGFLWTVGQMQDFESEKKILNFAF